VVPDLVERCSGCDTPDLGVRTAGTPPVAQHDQTAEQVDGKK
jgi:hypothetical protein